MSVQLTVRQKVIRVLSSALVGGLSVSFVVGETVDNKAHLLSKWESDPELLPSDFRPLAPISAAVKMIQAEEWRNQLVAKNGGGMGTLPSAIEVVASPARALASVDSVSTVNAAPLALPAAPIRAAVEVSLPVETKSVSRAEAPRVLAAVSALSSKAPTSAAAPAPVAEENEEPKHATAIPYGAFYGPAAPAQLAAMAPAASAPANSKLVAKAVPTDKPSSAEVQNLIASLKDATHRVSAYPQKTVANVMAAATIAEGGAVKQEPRITTLAGEPGMVMIEGAPEEVSSPVENVGLTAVEQGNWKIPGKILAPAGLPKGHFEVGLFSKIDQDGVPIGFPVVQQILPAGVLNFDLKVPLSLEKGYLYGEFVATKTGQRTWIAPPVNPWLRTDRQVAELVYQAEDAVTTVAAAASAKAVDAFRVSGSVGTLFTKPGSPIPQEEVLVKVRGRKESTRTNKDGTFHIDLPKIKGTVYLEFLKPGYHPSVVAVNTDGDGFQVKVDLASREAVEQVARMLGIRQVTSKGVFMGRAHGADGVGLRGLSVQSSVKAEGPFYFNEDGFPTTERKGTSADGRFLFLNLEPGAGYMESSLNGEPIAPFQFSTVEGGELVSKGLSPVGGSIKGRVFNPVAGGAKLQPLSGARVRIEGAADYAVSDSYGAFTIGPVRWMRGERIFLELSAEKYNNHRYSISPDKQKTGLNMFAFPALYISRLARSMDVDLDPYAGLVMGKVLGTPVRIDALADHSPVNAAKDFYFDTRGQLRGSHTMTDPTYGTYVIFNVPKGRTLLQGNDAGGALRYSEAVVSSPSSVSVIME